MKNINILHVIGAMDRAGAETFLMNVLRNIDRNKFKFYFLCYGDNNFDYEKEIENLGAVIIKVPFKKFQIIRNIYRIYKIIKEYKIDIVHSHTYYNSVFSVLAAKICKIKVIIHSHNTKPSHSPNIAQKIYYNISKFIINKYSNYFYACSDDAAKEMFYKKTNYSLIKNGIEIDKFIFDETKRIHLRKELNIEEDTKVICMVARFHEQKNHKFAIDVFNMYTKIDENSVLLLVGRGNTEEEIKKQVHEYRLQDKVKFLGVRKDVADIYSASDLFILPSLFEGLGIVLIEAQTNGLKCLVSTNVPKEVNITDEVVFMSLEDGMI